MIHLVAFRSADAGVQSFAVHADPALILMVLLVLSCFRPVAVTVLKLIKEVVPMVYNAIMLVAKEFIETLWTFSISVTAGLALLT